MGFAPIPDNIAEVLAANIVRVSASRSAMPYCSGVVVGKAAVLTLVECLEGADIEKEQRAGLVRASVALPDPSSSLPPVEAICHLSPGDRPSPVAFCRVAEELAGVTAVRLRPPGGPTPAGGARYVAGLGCDDTAGGRQGLVVTGARLLWNNADRFYTGATSCDGDQGGGLYAIDDASGGLRLDALAASSGRLNRIASISISSATLAFIEEMAGMTGASLCRIDGDAGDCAIAPRPGPARSLRREERRDIQSMPLRRSLRPRELIDILHLYCNRMIVSSDYLDAVHRYLRNASPPEAAGPLRQFLMEAAASQDPASIMVPVDLQVLEVPACPPLDTVLRREWFATYTHSGEPRSMQQLLAPGGVLQPYRAGYDDQLRDASERRVTPFTSFAPPDFEALLYRANPRYIPRGERQRQVRDGDEILIPTALPGPGRAGNSLAALSLALPQADGNGRAEGCRGIAGARDAIDTASIARIMLHNAARRGFETLPQIDVMILDTGLYLSEEAAGALDRALGRYYRSVAAQSQQFAIENILTPNILPDSPAQARIASHGTEVASLVLGGPHLARLQIGMTGGWSPIRISPSRVLIAGQGGTVLDTIVLNRRLESARHFVVVNMSLRQETAGPELPSDQRGAFYLLGKDTNANTLFVLAAGNGGQSGEGGAGFFPQSATIEATNRNMLAVAAVGRLENGGQPVVAGFSDRGPSWVQIGAPGCGVGVISFDPRLGVWTDAERDGTSFAAPQVSFVAALIAAELRGGEEYGAVRGTEPDKDSLPARLMQRLLASADLHLPPADRVARAEFCGQRPLPIGCGVADGRLLNPFKALAVHDTVVEMAGPGPRGSPSQIIAGDFELVLNGSVIAPSHQLRWLDCVDQSNEPPDVPLTLGAILRIWSDGPPDGGDGRPLRVYASRPRSSGGYSSYPMLMFQCRIAPGNQVIVRSRATSDANPYRSRLLVPATGSLPMDTALLTQGQALQAVRDFIPPMRIGMQ